MRKQRFVLVVYMTIAALLVLMPILPAAAKSNADVLPPKVSPSGETYHAIAFSSVKPATPLDGLAPSTATGCNDFTKGIDIYNSLGVKVATYAQEIFWCYNGSTITSKSRTRWGTVYSPLYQFNGHIGNTESGGVGQGSYRAWTQGSFCELAPGFGCVWNFYPWVDQTVYGTGSYTGSSGW